MDIVLSEEYKKAMDCALKYITDSMKSEKQVKDRLSAKGFSDEVITAVCEKLFSYGLLDDRKMSELYVEQTSSRHGKKRIAEMLRRRGVNEEIISETLNIVGDQYEAACNAAGKFMRTRERTRENLSKLFRHLVYKGFEYETVMRVVNEFAEGE